MKRDLALASRRRLLAATALVLPLLAACGPSSTPAPGPVPQYAQDAELLARALASLVGTLGTVKGLSPATVQRYAGYAAQAVAFAAQVAAAASAGAAQPTVKLLEGVVNAAVGALASSEGILPAGIKTALIAVSALLPIIEAAVGILVPATGPTMPPNIARLILADVVAGRV